VGALQHVACGCQYVARASLLHLHRLPPLARGKQLRAGRSDGAAAGFTLPVFTPKQLGLGFITPVCFEFLKPFEF
jgi:hypothetical protein